MAGERSRLAVVPEDSGEVVFEAVAWLTVSGCHRGTASLIPELYGNLPVFLEIRIGRIDDLNLIKCSDCLIIPLHTGKGIPFVEPCLGIVGIEGNCFFKRS